MDGLALGIGIFNFGMFLWNLKVTEGKTTKDAALLLGSLLIASIFIPLGLIG